MNKKIKLNDRLTIFCCVGNLFSKTIEGKFINKDIIQDFLSKIASRLLFQSIKFFNKTNFINDKERA